MNKFLHIAGFSIEPFQMSLYSVLSRLVVMWVWQTLISIALSTRVIKQHRAVLKEQIVSQ